MLRAEEEKFRISKRPCIFHLFYKTVIIHTAVLRDFSEYFRPFYEDFEDSPKVIRKPDERRTFKNILRKLPKIAEDCRVLLRKI